MPAISSKTGLPCKKINFPLKMSVFLEFATYINIASVAPCKRFGKLSFVIGMCFSPEVVPEVTAKYFGRPGHKTFFLPSFISLIYFFIPS